MGMNIGKEVSALQRMTVKELRRKYEEVFGEGTNGCNKAWLIKRIAWRIQARAEGGLSERARQRAAELADDADLRLNPPPMKVVPVLPEKPVKTLQFQTDERLPPPGTMLIREYKGEKLMVLVRSDGFEYEGTVYTSLSAVAKAITGSHCNGFLFFRINAKGGKP
ncbi:MAG: DUF2924 domain-containing protein [Bacteroidales bacterium]|nr:DUF2924 domain-containing protein [Bacteroidales bacterium]